MNGKKQVHRKECLLEIVHEMLLHKNMNGLVLMGRKASDLSLLPVDAVDGMKAIQRSTSVRLPLRLHRVVTLLVGPGRDIRWNVQDDVLGCRCRGRDGSFFWWSSPFAGTCLLRAKRHRCVATPVLGTGRGGRDCCPVHWYMFGGTTPCESPLFCSSHSSGACWIGLEGGFQVDPSTARVCLSPQTFLHFMHVSIVHEHTVASHPGGVSHTHTHKQGRYCTVSFSRPVCLSSPWTVFPWSLLLHLPPTIGDAIGP